MTQQSDLFYKLLVELQQEKSQRELPFPEDDKSDEIDLFGDHDQYDAAQDAIDEARKQSQLLKQDNQRLQQEADEHQLRIKTFNKLFFLMVTWLLITLSILIRAGCGPSIEGDVFQLSDGVLITLLSTTTINVLGIFAIAAKWLFPKK